MRCNAHTRPAGSYCPLVTPSERTCTRMPQNWARYNYFRALYSTRTAAWAAFLVRPRVNIPAVLNGEGIRHLNTSLQCFYSAHWSCFVCFYPHARYTFALRLNGLGHSYWVQPLVCACRQTRLSNYRITPISVHVYAANSRRYLYACLLPRHRDGSACEFTWNRMIFCGISSPKLYLLLDSQTICLAGGMTSFTCHISIFSSA